MASDPLILGFDTSAAHCAAALICGERVLASRCEEMARGQAERLMPLLEEILAEGGASWRDLSRIGVGVGPGNFTGIRISVSAARGLALSLNIPAVGVSTFEAIRFEATAPCLPAVPAPREQLFIAPEHDQPKLVSSAEAHALDAPIALPPAPEVMAGRIAFVARAKAIDEITAPAPLYIRPADAAPSRNAPPVILDDA